ncbi:MAG: alginate O-acetyltransferase AlgX-related protein [Alkalispirochaeta sp.]
MKGPARSIVRFLHTRLGTFPLRRCDLPLWVVVIGVLGGLIAGVSGDGVASAIGTTVTALDLPAEAVDGSFTQVVDDAVESHHPFRPAAVMLVTVPRYLLFRETPEGVVVGRDGRLFTAEELEVTENDESRRARRTAHIISQAEAASDRQITTVVVLMPSKARIAVERLPRKYRDAALNPRYDRTIRDLREAGIPVVDPRPVLTPERFFSRDTHWRPEGAAAVAGSVADAVPLPAAMQTPFRLEPRDPGSVGGTATGDATAPGVVEFEGDLLSFVPVGPFATLLGLTPERYRPVVAVPGADRSGGDSPAAGGLFDTPTIPVSLVGTSYSADERWGFAEHLKVQLSADVLNVATSGEGPFVPMADYLAGDTVREIPPEVIVWEIPERYLTLPGYSVSAPADRAGSAAPEDG